MDSLNGKKIILQRVKDLYPTRMDNVVSVLCTKMMKYSKDSFVLEFVWPQVINFVTCCINFQIPSCQLLAVL